MNDPGFRYLNLDNTWPAFSPEHRRGLTIREDGALTLSSIPQAEVPWFSTPLDANAEQYSTRISEDAIGNLYIADPVNHRILRQEVCTGEIQPLPYWSSPGSEPGQLRSPHSVLVGTGNALYVADTDNHRIQVIDLPTLQLRAIWGQPNPLAAPESSPDPGRFQHPWDLIQDEVGNIYVAEAGIRNSEGIWQAGRVQKFDPLGRLDPSFTTINSAFPGADSPLKLAIAALIPTDPSRTILDRQRLVILDRQSPRLWVYHLDGSYDETITRQWQAALAHPQAALSQPNGLGLTADTLYISDASSGQVGCFAVNQNLNGNPHENLNANSNISFVGFARGYRGAIAALGINHAGQLLIYAGSSNSITRLLPHQAYLETGQFLAGPFSVSTQPTHWQRLRAIAEPLSNTTHIQFFTYTSTTKDRPLSVPETLTDPTLTVAATPLGQWRAAPRDALDLLILNEPAPYLWIAGIFRGDGSCSPVLHQMRLEFDRPTWLQYLPPLYQHNETSRVFLERSLSLFASLLEDEETLIDDLPLLFDPQAAPDHPPQSWLDWLASWLDFPLDESWREGDRRQALAEAFSHYYKQRGTMAGLQNFIQLYAGVHARLQEPSRFNHLWSLGETSTLGFNTRLVPAQAQGAVLDTTALLDQSHLIRDEDYGAPLFEDIAHHFCVQVYAAESNRPVTLTKIQQILDREKPAHTTYQICPIEARMRVGFQAQIGIDTLIGQPPSQMLLNQPQALGWNTVLAEAPDQSPAAGVIGKNIRIGLHKSLI
ncbi:MAG: phage tail protein [Elainella sp. Prado103]|nr:phage tail protein [Elainella sp. Prado103]